ncbi:unnamed protein product [Rotaria magnacalcarata]|uniref:Uncharacterized protein n=6 Tax=Rotaria magnacalcarata TaxID=392030 RepID=A0A816X7A1_9BILA|nr:unnamed protein product [Rotaria magnacalcarata]
MSISRPKRRLHLEYKRNWRRSILDKDLQQILSTSADIETTSIEEEGEEEERTEKKVKSGGLYESNKYTDDESEESTEYIESFIDEINSNNNDVETPLYPGSAISIRDACDRLIHLVNLLGLDKAKTCLLLKELRSFFPLGCRLPRTIFTLVEMTNNDYRSEVSVRCVECGQVLVQSNEEKCSTFCIHNGKHRSYANKVELAIMNVEIEIKRVAERYINLINDYLKQAEHLVPCDIINGMVASVLNKNSSLVFLGQIYHQMSNSKSERNITIILHTDGAPAVKASKKSIWPVQATIAEIPIPLRDWKSAVMVFGIWLASSKPPRDHLLKPITIQLQKLMESKILLKQANGSHLWYNVRVQQAIFDLPASAHLLNIVQYNGYDGCGDCFIKGVTIGRQVYFPFSEKVEKLKTHQFYLKNNNHTSSRPVHGKKGSTPLSTILQLPAQAPYDSMHLIYHGHVKTLLKEWHKVFDFNNKCMDRPKRIRKPLSRYDPNIYVLASFPKRNKHGVIPKHQVAIDSIDENNGTIRPSGFIQSIRIIGEGTQAKCQEKATKYSRHRGSEEIEIQQLNNNEDKEVDDNYVYTNENFYRKDDVDYLPPTTNFSSTYNTTKPTSSNKSVDVYQHSRLDRECLRSDDEMEEFNCITPCHPNKDNANNSDQLSPTPLVIEEQSMNNHNTQDNNVTDIPSKIDEDVSDAAEQDDDDLILSRVKSMKKKRKTKFRSLESDSSTTIATEVSNIQKEFLSFRYNIEKRVKSIEKTFRVLKKRKVLQERNDIINAGDTSLSSRSSDSEIVLGVDISKFNLGFDEHTKFVRQILRQVGYAADPNVVLTNENMVAEIQSTYLMSDK